MTERRFDTGWQISFDSDSFGVDANPVVEIGAFR